jgi:hypothetical protein
VRLLADEGVHQGVVTALRQAEYAVTYVADTMPGAADKEVLSKADELAAVPSHQTKTSVSLSLGRILRIEGSFSFDSPAYHSPNR